MIAESTATSPKVRLVKAENLVKINVGSVKIEAGMPRMAGMPKLPVQETKEIAAPAMMPGSDSGRMISRNTRKLEAPESRAASTPSRGSVISPARSAR